MGAFSFPISKDLLPSRQIRLRSTGDSGKRSIGSPLWQDVLRFFGFGAVGSAFIKIGINLIPGGFIIRTLAIIGFGVIIGWLIQAARTIWNFNWNITDNEIQARFAQLQLGVIARLGETWGNLTGWVLCGFGPSYLIAKINPALGLYLYKKVGEEALEEFASNVAFLTRSIASAAIQSSALHIYKNVRRWIKRKDSPVYQLGKQLFGTSFQRIVDAWGENGAKPWSFAKAFNDYIDDISPRWAQVLLENYWEEMMDACEEALYIVGWGIDEWIATQVEAKNQVLGDDQGVEIIPDREANDDIPTSPSRERLVLVGKEEILKPVIVQTMANYSLLDNRDVGQIVGEPARDYIKKLTSEFQIRILWINKPSPPFGSASDKSKVKSQFTLQEVKRTKLEWELIKQLTGGENGRMWGRFRARATCSDSSQPTLYAATAEEAKDLLTSLITELTDLTILNIDVVEELRVGKRQQHPSLYKTPTRIYPAYLTIFNKARVLNEEDGRAELSGIYKNRQYRIPLWPQNRPPEWEAVIQEIFRTPGADTP